MQIVSEDTGWIIVCLYLMISLVAWKSLRYSIQSGFGKYLFPAGVIYFLTGFCLMSGFCYIFLFHPDSSRSWYYSYHSWLNALILADLFCKVPLLISSLCLFGIRNPRTKRIISKMAVIMSLGGLLYMANGILMSPRILKTRHIILDFPDLPPAFDGLRILQFSDTHFGSSGLEHLLKKAGKISQDFRPDLVFFTGDLVNNYAIEVKPYIADLTMFDAAIGKFAIPGNHDYGDYSEWPDISQKIRNATAIREAFRESGFDFLHNESRKIRKGNDSLFIAGLENWGHAHFPHYANLQKATRNLPDTAFTIMLSHDPASWDSIKGMDRVFPLTLSGHTHGFQWGIYLAGIECNPLRVVQKYWGGLYRDHNRLLYVNRGAGMVGMHLRVDMPAEITLLTLQRSKINR